MDNNYLDGKVTSGVFIAKLDEKGSAAQAGLKVNDIILKIDNNKVTNVANLRYYIYQHKIGDTLKLEVYRDDKTITVEMKLVK